MAGMDRWCHAVAGAGATTGMQSEGDRRRWSQQGEAKRKNEWWRRRESDYKTALKTGKLLKIK